MNATIKIHKRFEDDRKVWDQTMLCLMLPCYSIMCILQPAKSVTNPSFPSSSSSCGRQCDIDCLLAISYQ